MPNTVISPAMTIEPIVPSTLRRVVCDRLRDLIVSGALAPGSLLRETAIAMTLGVSPTPVREAFGDLAAEGLVEVEAHRLKRVTPIDLRAMLDLLRVQIELWRLGYVWGMANLDDADDRALADAVSAYRAALAKDDVLGAIRAGHAFHTVIITASDNRELLRSTLDRRSLIARFILLHGRHTVSVRGLRQHDAILHALQRGDSRAALSGLEVIGDRLIGLAQNAPADAAAALQENSDGF